MIGNQLRRRLSGVSAGLSGQALHTARGADKTRLAEWAVRFVIAFILSGAQILGGISPFAAGFVAAAGSSGGAIAALAGAVSGYLLAGSFFWALQYVCICVIICTTIIVFRDTQLFRTAWFMPLAAAVISLCIGIAVAARAGWSFPAVAVLLSNVVLAGGGAYFYKAALSSWSGRFNLEQTAEIIHTISFLILVSTMLMSLAQVTVFGVVSIGRTLATLVVFLAAFKGGVGMGCAAGISVGLAMDSVTGGAPIFATAYGLAGLVSGVFSRHSRFVFAVAYILVDAVVAAVSIGNAGVPAILYEVFVASVVFMVLPTSFMARLSVLVPGAGTGCGILRARAYTKDRVHQTALAFRELYETVRHAAGSSRNDNDVAAVFDRAADTACLGCDRMSRCWHQDYQSTVDAMNNATAAMLRRGYLEAGDLPSHFVESCARLPEFICAVNMELKSLLYRRQYKKRLQDNQTTAFRQYGDISAILTDISDELGSGIRFEPEYEIRLRKYLRSINVQAETAVFRDRGGRLHAEIFGASFKSLKRDPGYLDKLSAVFNVRLCAVDDEPAPDRILLLEAEPLSATVGTAARRRSEQTVSGDRGAYFKTDEGLLYVILSDGMGTGSDAAKYAGDAVRILERFLRAGVRPETAVRMLNDLLVLKNEDDTLCVTVDLVRINLFTGDARMFKYGAAPSYLRHGNTVRCIQGKSMAAGLGVPPHDAPDQLRMELKAGSLAVIVSDGVTAGLDDGWLRDAISTFDGDDPKALAMSLVETAAAKYGAEDDMTAIAITVADRP